MFDILAISYQNIGPFQGNPISIFFQNGKHLVKAPIGSGKSFLFFDGPAYGIYKYNSRGILNNQSKEGFIKIAIKYQDQTRLIIRNISKARVKESCSSTLYRIAEIDLNYPEIIYPNMDIEKLWQKSGAILEKLEFKNETDLQQQILSMLPPREVFVNTVFLMQDSDNIFELTPADRLTVLKNVFGLLSIDEAKEIIAEQRRETTYRLKSYSDTSKFNEKISKLIKELIFNHKQLESENISQIQNLLSTKNQTIDELTIIQDQLTIQDLNISIFSPEINQQIHSIIQTEKDKHNRNTNQIENYKKSIETIKNKIDSTRQKLISMQKDNAELQKNINEIEKQDFEEFKKQDNLIKTKKQEINKQIPQEKIQNFLTKSQSYSELKEYSNYSGRDISDLYSFIQQLTILGKNFNSQVETKQATIQNKKQQNQNKLDQISLSEKNILEQIQNLQNQQKETIQDIQNLEQLISKQSTFFCEKTQGNCPFVKEINRQAFDKLEEQKQAFLNKQQIIEQNINTKNQELENILADKKLQSKPDTNKDIPLLEKEIIALNQSLELLKNFLKEIDRKKIEEQNHTYNELKIQEETLSKKIKDLEELQIKKEEYKQKIISNSEVQKILESEIQNNEKEMDKINKEKTELENKIQTGLFQKLLNAEKTNNQYIIIQRDLQNTIADFKKLQIEIEELKKQEKQLNNLYEIFSKELLLLVLQDHLPVLNDIINNYLSQIVSYEISLKLNKSSSDKLELEANIIDNHGEREIKSLSGGQKIILKLVWMLSISSYVRSPLLFLDETINNLDGETVAKVADLIENFIKQKNIKFFTVTHNQQIQDMQIRDQTIEVSQESLNTGNNSLFG